MMGQQLGWKLGDSMKRLTPAAFVIALALTTTAANGSESSDDEVATVPRTMLPFRYTAVTRTDEKGKQHCVIKTITANNTILSQDFSTLTCDDLGFGFLEVVEADGRPVKTPIQITIEVKLAPDAR